MRSISVLALACGLALLGGCGDADEDPPEFLASAEDELIDPDDPPDDPDPALDDDEVASDGESSTVSSALTAERKKKKKKKKPGWKPDNGGMGCGTAKTLSPAGLTFVIHVSKDNGNAARLVSHLTKLKGYIRQRDLFLVDHGSPAVEGLRALFPCNRFHSFVRQPNELAATLDSLGEGYEGVAVDWELYEIRDRSQTWSIRRLDELADKIHARGKRAGFIPFWFGRDFSDKKVMRGSHMQYVLPQIQNACVEGPAKFAKVAHGVAKEFGPGGVRDVGFEISMNSYGNVDNHVGPARAAACTEAAYRKGARAIYIYGNADDHFPEYFQRLGKAHVREQN